MFNSSLAHKFQYDESLLRSPLVEIDSFVVDLPPSSTSLYVAIMPYRGCQIRQSLRNHHFTYTITAAYSPQILGLGMLCTPGSANSEIVANPFQNTGRRWMSFVQHSNSFVVPCSWSSKLATCCSLTSNNLVHNACRTQITDTTASIPLCNGSFTLLLQSLIVLMMPISMQQGLHLGSIVALFSAQSTKHPQQSS